MAKKATVKKPPLVEVEESEPEQQYGARPSKATVCAFCDHLYIKPCTVKTRNKCPNYLHLQLKGKGKPKQ